MPTPSPTSINTSTIGEEDKTLKMFTIFSDLPLELRDDIWSLSVVPRLVHWRPGGGKPPADLLVSKESRKATRVKYHICHNTFFRHGQYSIFINFDIDTVYRKQGGLSNMVKMYNFPCEAIDIPNNLTTSADVVIKADLFWNIQPWIRYLKVLTIDLHSAATSNVFSPVPLSVIQPIANGQTIWIKIKCVCPDLQELKVVLNGRLEKRTTLEELVENDAGDPQDLEQQRLMQVVRDGLQLHRSESHLIGLKLTFVNFVPSVDS